MAVGGGDDGCQCCAGHCAVTSTAHSGGGECCDADGQLVDRFVLQNQECAQLLVPVHCSVAHCSPRRRYCLKMK